MLPRYSHKVSRLPHLRTDFETPSSPLAIKGCGLWEYAVAELTMVCPSCSGIYFGTPRTPQSEAEFIGAVCGGCGHRLTEEDINQFVDSWTADRLRDAIKSRRA
jgi:hypothetical protein